MVVDTDILIDAGRGEQEAISCLQEIEYRSQLTTTAVTQMELMVGCRNKRELRSLERLLSRFYVLRISETVTDRAVNLLRTYRLSHGLLIADALIAAIVLEHEESFITKNQRDFRFIAGLSLMSYPWPASD